MIKINAHYGIVIRKASLLQRQVKLSDVSAALEASAAPDSDEFLVSFGPSFGEEASNEFVHRLKVLGLHYADDFFVFYGDFPNWCEFHAACTE